MADAYICRRGGSGGSGGGGFELIVTGGTVSPAKATHNTIWLNTSHEITSCVFSAIEPENPAQGMALIMISDSGKVKVCSPVDGNWITVYPISAKQYIGGAWVDVEAKSYQNGEWMDWWTGMYLFDEGDQCVDITGGWVIGGLNINATYGDGVATIGDVLTVTTKTSTGTINRQSAIATKNAINVSGYKTLKIVVDDVMPSNAGVIYCCFGLSADKAAHTATKGITGTGEMSMDISTMSGSYYPFIHVSNSDRRLVVSKIWFE